MSGLSEGAVTLVEGASFCISAAFGDISPGSAQGLFYRDSRYLSCWQLRLDGDIPQLLSTIAKDPYSATFVGRGRPVDGEADSNLLIVRNRYVGDGMREDLFVRNLGRTSIDCVITITMGADFAHLFEVKESRVKPPTDLLVDVQESSVNFRRNWPDKSRGTHVKFSSDAQLEVRSATFNISVPPKSEWSTCFEVHLEMDELSINPRYRCGQPVEEAAPAFESREWKELTPRLVGGSGAMRRALVQSGQDLGALRIFDPSDPERTVLAAGVPWFMTLFGRDSLFASWMSLPVDPSIAASTLVALARYQGSVEVLDTEEQPGRILHEMRWGMNHFTSKESGDLYYGTADATPLFVMLLGELSQWGIAPDLLARLLPHADRALEWIELYGDRDGDGFVEYERATPRGLANQGWKDSWDGVNFSDGSLAEAPIALCEVQGYVYAAYRCRAQMASELGDLETAAKYTDKAEQFKVAFNEAFWISDRGYFAIGLDRDKKQIDSLTSNIGHCLWSGIVDADKAEQIARHLMSPEMFNGWGIRTLASTMGAYNPVSYHNGSVWPHDTAIAAAGLMRYGFVKESYQLVSALLDASQSFEGRLPELFCGFDRREFPAPVRYPTSCSPQAWSAATPFSLLRTVLRFDPSVPHHMLWIDPVVLEDFDEFRVENISLGSSALTVIVTPAGTTLEGLSPDMKVVEHARYPLRGAT